MCPSLFRIVLLIFVVVAEDCFAIYVLALGLKKENQFIVFELKLFWDVKFYRIILSSYQETLKKLPVYFSFHLTNLYALICISPCLDVLRFHLGATHPAFMALLGRHLFQNAFPNLLHTVFSSVRCALSWIVGDTVNPGKLRSF